MKAISVRVWLPLASMASTSALYSTPRWRNSAGTGRRRAEVDAEHPQGILSGHHDLVADDVHARCRDRLPCDHDMVARHLGVVVGRTILGPSGMSWVSRAVLSRCLPSMVVPRKV